MEFLDSNDVAGEVAVVGCGFGHDVRAISRDGARVTGIDLAPSAVAGALEFPKVGNETYLPADLFDLPGELIGRFDWVFEHTCFCAIEPGRRSDYVKAVDALLKPEGIFLAVFYMDPDHEEGPPFGTTEAELDALFAARFELVRQWLPKTAYEGRQGRELMRLLRKKRA